MTRYSPCRLKATVPCRILYGHRARGKSGPQVVIPQQTRRDIAAVEPLSYINPHYPFSTSRQCLPPSTSFSVMPCFLNIWCSAVIRTRTAMTAPAWLSTMNIPSIRLDPLGGDRGGRSPSKYAEGPTANVVTPRP